MIINLLYPKSKLLSNIGYDSLDFQEDSDSKASTFCKTFPDSKLCVPFSMTLAFST